MYTKGRLFPTRGWRIYVFQFTDGMIWHDLGAHPLPPVRVGERLCKVSTGMAGRPHTISMTLHSQQA